MAVPIESEVVIPGENVDAVWEYLERKYKETLQESHEFNVDTLEVEWCDFIMDGVLHEDLMPVRRLQRAIHSAGFDMSVDPEGNMAYVGISLEEDESPYGEAHLEFWRVLAPFVKEGSNIIFQGDEGEIVRWRFENKKLHVDYMIRYVWDSDPDAATVLSSLVGDGSLFRYALKEALDLLKMIRSDDFYTDEITLRRLDKTIERAKELLEKS